MQFNGCPDSDEDGVSDKADECPNEKGTLELGGCPDRDGDKVADNKDACPDQPGVAERKGCPAPSLTYFSGDIDRETVMQTGGVFSFLSEINIKNAKFKLSGYSADTIKTAFITAP
ncbi:MAG: OmpA family protein, partial [Flavobacteriales bacterium]